MDVYNTWLPMVPLLQQPKSKLTNEIEAQAPPQMSLPENLRRILIFFHRRVRRVGVIVLQWSMEYFLIVIIINMHMYWQSLSYISVIVVTLVYLHSISLHYYLQHISYCIRLYWLGSYWTHITSLSDLSHRHLSFNYCKRWMTRAGHVWLINSC